MFVGYLDSLHEPAPDPQRLQGLVWQSRRACPHTDDRAVSQAALTDDNR
jgi:hypothetical protein